MEKLVYVVETNKETGRQYLWATGAAGLEQMVEGMNIVYPEGKFPRTRGTFEVVDELPTPCYLAANGKQIR